MSVALTVIPCRIAERAYRLLAALLVVALSLSVTPTFIRDHATPRVPSRQAVGVGQATVAPDALRDVPPNAARPKPRTAPGAPAIAASRALPTLISSTLAADRDAGYTVSAPAATPGALQATNAAQGFTTRFDTSGVRIDPLHGGGWTLHATALLAGGASLPLAATAPVRSGNRVEYRRDGLTEWYANDARGLEQGFSLAAPPAGSDQFALALAVDGAPPVMAPDGAIQIGDERYAGLTVTDAAGAVLPAGLSVDGGEIRIAVDAHGAAWPVTIDPFVTRQTLTAGGDAAANDQFGFSVAAATLNGATTIVVGAPFKQVDQPSNTTGAAYVFTGSQGSYTLQSRLTVTGSQFVGLTVAVTMTAGGTNIFVGDRNGHIYVFTGGATNPTATLTPPSADSLAATTDGTTTTIAVGSTQSNGGAGGVWLFAGSGTSYPLQTQLSPADTSQGADYGFSVAIAYDASTGKNTVVTGSPNRTVNGQFYTGGAAAFIGSGSSYTPFNVILLGNDTGQLDEFGYSVAVVAAGGQNTIVVGAPGHTVTGGYEAGAAYVERGAGTTIGNYVEQELTDSEAQQGEQFGYSVAVGLAGGTPVVAVGAPRRNTYITTEPNNNVMLFQQTQNYQQTFLPESGGTSGDGYGQGLAMTLDASGNLTVIAGTPGGNSTGTATASFAVLATTPVPGQITPLEDNDMVVGGASGGFGTYPYVFMIGVQVQDLGYNDIPNLGVTFTVQPNGGAYAVFDPNNAGSLSTHLQTDSTGEADVTLFPSAGPGTFQVTATVDGGSGLQTTFNLKITPQAPVPAINRLDNADYPGLLPALVPASAPNTIQLQIHGTGFTPQTRIVFPNNVTVQPYWADGTWLFWDAPAGFFLLSGGTYGYLPVLVRTPARPGLTEGGDSNTVNLLIYDPNAAPAGSTDSLVGNQTVLVPDGSSILPPPILVQNNGQPVSGVDGTGNNLIGAKSGSLITDNGGGVISDNGSGLISDHGGGVISDNGSGLISDNGGGVISDHGLGLISDHGAGVISDHGAGLVGNSGGTSVRPSVVNNAAVKGNAYGFTDGNGLFIAPPITSNGTPGTYTSSIVINGVGQPMTITFINLNPKDGHPATITSLSKTSANAGAPGFTLTVTGSGFVSGSVVSFGGVQLPTTFVSGSQLTVAIPAVLLNYVGKHNVLVINPDPNGGASLPATFTVIAPATSVTQTSLPNGATGTAYSQQFTATGGSGADFFFATGNFPPGLSFTYDGRLVGTPTQGGSFTFTVTAYDKHFIGVSASQALTIIIVGPTLAVASGTSGSLKIGQTVQLHATLTNPGGTPQDVSSQVQWVSSNPAIITVANAGDAGKTPGMATAESPGAVTITVTLNGATSQPISLTVGTATPIGIPGPAPAPAGRPGGAVGTTGGVPAPNPAPPPRP